MRPDRPTLGIALMLAFCVTVPFADAFAKLAGATLPLVMLLAARFVVQALVLTPVSLASEGGMRLTPRLLRLTALRAVLNLTALAMIYASFRFLPLADAIAIAYVMPFILFFLGHYLMDEEVGPRRVAAAVAGFVGTLFVVQPSFAEVGWPALLPVGAAVLFAVFILVTRMIAREASPLALQAISGWLGIGMLIPVMGLGALFGITDATPVPATAREWGLMVGIGVFGTVSHLLMALSLRHAPSSTVAPVQYLEIPVAVCVGWLFFREFPNGLALFGVIVILSAGLYIVMRERGLSRLRDLPAGAAARPAEE